MAGPERRFHLPVRAIECESEPTQDSTFVRKEKLREEVWPVPQRGMMGAIPRVSKDFFYLASQKPLDFTFSSHIMPSRAAF